jgi:hypothetical protein
MQLYAFTTEKYRYQNTTCAKKNCCKPFKKHNETVRKGLRQVSADNAKLVNKYANIRSGLIKPGQK